MDDQSKAADAGDVGGGERFRAAFRRFDKDDSGFISADELFDVLRDLGHNICTAMCGVRVWSEGVRREGVVRDASCGRSIWRVWERRGGEHACRRVRSSTTCAVCAFGVGPPVGYIREWPADLPPPSPAILPALSHLDCEAKTRTLEMLSPP